MRGRRRGPLGKRRLIQDGKGIREQTERVQGLAYKRGRIFTTTFRTSVTLSMTLFTF
jgi:hypothetical protein